VPSARPAFAPSAFPTPPGADCTSYCAIESLGSFGVAYGKNMGLYRMPSYFTIMFDIIGPAASSSSSLRNSIFEFVDANDGGSYLNICMTDLGDVQINYDGVTFVEHAPLLVRNYHNTTTRVAIAVHPGQIEVSSDALGLTIYTGATDIDTSSTSYYLYTSNSRQGTAGGMLSGFSITGTGYFAF
jgi:hypothetical protein